MTLFLILAPYGAFVFLMLVTSATFSLLVAAAICLATIALDAFRGRSVKILPAGSALVFFAITLYLDVLDPGLSSSQVKVVVDTAIFAISLGSMLVRRPFTLQYAIEAVPAEIAAMPGFLHANYIITGAWALAALLMMLANLAVIYVPGLPIWLSIAIALAARNSAVFFTKWYPAYRRAKYPAPAANALPRAH
jgi:intracellular septation protein A